MYVTTEGRSRAADWTSHRLHNVVGTNRFSVQWDSKEGKDARLSASVDPTNSFRFLHHWESYMDVKHFYPWKKKLRKKFEKLFEANSHTKFCNFLSSYVDFIFPNLLIIYVITSFYALVVASRNYNPISLYNLVL